MKIRDTNLYFNDHAWPYIILFQTIAALHVIWCELMTKATGDIRNTELSTRFSCRLHLAATLSQHMFSTILVCAFVQSYKYRFSTQRQQGHMIGRRSTCWKAQFPVESCAKFKICDCLGNTGRPLKPEGSANGEAVGGLVIFGESDDM